MTDPKFNDRNPLSIIDHADRVARASGLPGRSNGPQDALRHMLGSAEATLRYSEPVAHAASEFRETFSSNTENAARMDRHNDSIGRSLAEKHGNMLDVLEEALAHIHEGSGAPGGPVWITDHKPADFPAEAQEKARSAAKTTYEDPEPNKRLDPQIVDDDDLDRVEHMKSIAKTAPDEDPLALDKIFALFLYILTQIDQRDELAPVLEPGIPEDLRLDRLLEAVQKHRLTDLLPVEIGDTGVDRQKLLDEIRKRRLPDRTGSLQPRWSDPAPNIDAKQNNTTRPR